MTFRSKAVAYLGVEISEMLIILVAKHLQLPAEAACRGCLPAIAGSLGVWHTTTPEWATPEQVLTQCLHLGGRCIAE